MDNLTHGLLGLFIGIVVYYLLRFKTKRRTAIIAAIIAAELPDIDIVIRAVSAGFYLVHHREITHSLIVVVGVALVMGYIFHRITKEKYWKYTALCLAGLACHVFLDIITSFGTQFFYPFNNLRYAFSLVPIVDIYVLLIFGIGVAFLRMQPKDWYKVAKAVLFIFFIFLIFKSGLHFHAMDKVGDLAGYDDINVVPHILNPFGWRVIVDEPTHYLISDFDLTMGGYAGFLVFEKKSTANIEASKKSLLARQFLTFSKFPYAEEDGNIVRWVDMRYSVEKGTPFGAEIVLDDDLNVVSEKLQAR